MKTVQAMKIEVKKEIETLKKSQTEMKQTMKTQWV